MALYQPAGARRRRTIIFVVVAVVIGLVIGLLLGRVTAPTVKDQVSSVRDDARRTAAGLRVSSLHDQAGTVSNQGSSQGGADVVLTNTRKELDDELARAIWMPAATKAEVLAALEALAKRTDRTSSGFGKEADQVAGTIDAAFGVSGS